MYWATEDASTLMRRAIHHRDRLREHFQQGRNPLLEWTSAPTKEPTPSEKRAAGGEAACALMAGYVDDCSMDAKDKLQDALWTSIRVLFESAAPEDVQKIVGLIRTTVTIGSRVHPALTQESYMENFLQQLPPEWSPRRAVRTTGTAENAPDPALLDKTPCPLVVRPILGSLQYAARGTRPDLSYPTSRLARYADRWSDKWCEKELRHILAYCLGSCATELCMRFEGEPWEELWLDCFSDANFAAPCSDGGYCLFLRGARGTIMPLDWRSRRQRATATSSTESELMEWADAAKAALRFQGLLNACRVTEIAAQGHVDNDATRIAVGRGSSAKLAHMRKHAEVCLQFLQQCGVPIKRVDTTDNPADIFTKTLSSQRLLWHLGMFTGKVADPTNRVAVDKHDPDCRHHGCTDVGTAKAVIVFGCPCIQVRLLVGLLACAPVVDAMQQSSRRRRATTWYDVGAEEADQLDEAVLAFCTLCFFVVAALISVARLMLTLEREAERPDTPSFRPSRTGLLARMQAAGGVFTPRSVLQTPEAAPEAAKKPETEQPEAEPDIGPTRRAGGGERRSEDRRGEEERQGDNGDHLEARRRQAEDRVRAARTARNHRAVHRATAPVGTVNSPAGKAKAAPTPRVCLACRIMTVRTVCWYCGNHDHAAPFKERLVVTTRYGKKWHTTDMCQAVKDSNTKEIYRHTCGR